MKNNWVLTLCGFGIRRTYEVAHKDYIETRWTEISISELRYFPIDCWASLYAKFNLNGGIPYKVSIIETEKILNFLTATSTHYLFLQAVAISNRVTEEKIQKIMASIVEEANTRPFLEPIFRKTEDFDQYDNYSIFPQLFIKLYLKSLFNFASASYSYLSTDKIPWTSPELFPDARTDANYFAFDIADIPQVSDTSDCDAVVQLRIIPQEEMRAEDKRGKLSTPFIVTFRVITGAWLKKNIPYNDLFFTQRTLIVNRLSKEVIQEHIDYCLTLFATCTDRVDALATLSIFFDLPEHALRLFYEWEVNL